MRCKVYVPPFSTHQVQCAQQTTHELRYSLHLVLQTIHCSCAGMLPAFNMFQAVCVKGMVTDSGERLLIFEFAAKQTYHPISAHSETSESRP